MNASANRETAIALFLGMFDAYEAARASLRQAEEGSADERYCIANCASLWQQLVNARSDLGQSET